MPSPVPDNVVNKSLYAKIKAELRRNLKPGQRWGAYTSGQLVRQYKARGGTYSGPKKKRRRKSRGASPLSRWYREKWVDACAYPKIKPCGRDDAKKGRLTYCRPLHRVSSATPSTVKEIGRQELRRRCRKKGTGARVTGTPARRKSTPARRKRTPARRKSTPARRKRSQGGARRRLLLG